MFGREGRAREILQLFDYEFVREMYVSVIAIRHGETRSCKLRELHPKGSLRLLCAGGDHK
jgi:hypothetical protein